MKIISKFKDFYEYDAHRYGEPDPAIVWVRNTNEEPISVTGMLKHEVDRYLLTSYQTHWTDYKNRSRRYSFYNYVELREELIGIYPYLYYAPVLLYTSGYGNTLKVNADMSKKIFTGEEDIKNLLKRRCLDHRSFIYPHIILDEKLPRYIRNSTCRDIKDFDNYVSKNEKLFDIIGEPTFLIDRHRKFDEPLTYLYKNPKLVDTSLLAYHPNINDQRWVYGDLENYLWSKKQEPVSEPDNKTKILSHGFDTKTSFRNM